MKGEEENLFMIINKSNKIKEIDLIQKKPSSNFIENKLKLSDEICDLNYKQTLIEKMKFNNNNNTFKNVDLPLDLDDSNK